MLHILLLILKIIGLILLVLLGVVLIVLFVPVCYQIEADTDDGIKQLKAGGKASWLFHLLSASFSYDDGLKWKVRIGWKECHQNDNPSLEKKIADEDNKSCDVQTICDKIKKIWEAKEQIADFLTDDVHVSAFQSLKREIVHLLKRVHPKTIRGYLRFGLEDPYYTGQVLAGLSVLYPFYGDNIQIYPDFEKSILEGKIKMKGYTCLSHFLVPIFKLYFNENIRKTYNDYKRRK